MNRYITWCLIFLAVFAILYLSKAILMPFIISLIISYMLSPLALKLEGLGMSKFFTSTFLIFILLLIFFSLWVLLIPLIYEQITRFIENIPQYRDFVNKSIIPVIIEQVKKINSAYVMKVQDKLGSIVQLILEDLVLFIQKIWKSGFVFVSFLSMIVLVPLISFYLIKDWSEMTGNLMDLVPKTKKNTIKELVYDINNSLSGFFRGQLNICFILSIYYSVALLAVGLNFGVFIGITTGILSFIPFLGLLGGFLSATLIAFFQFKSWYGVLAVVVVFLLGNIIEGVLSPKIIGKKLGLHPVWIIFFVLLGGSLFGIVGMLLAVPCGAIISILVKFFIRTYYSSKLYKT